MKYCFVCIFKLVRLWYRAVYNQEVSTLVHFTQNHNYTNYDCVVRVNTKAVSHCYLFELMMQNEIGWQFILYEALHYNGGTVRMKRASIPQIRCLYRFLSMD